MGAPRDPERVAAAYTRTRSGATATSSCTGRVQIVEFLGRKWDRELDYGFGRTCGRSRTTASRCGSSTRAGRLRPVVAQLRQREWEFADEGSCAAVRRASTTSGSTRPIAASAGRVPNPSTARRSRWPERSMAVDLVIDIENTPGALAQVAAAISDAGVNIAAATCMGRASGRAGHPRPARRGREACAGDLPSRGHPRARGVVVDVEDVRACSRT